VGRILEKDDVTEFEGSFKGTNEGPLKLPGGDLPPTNRPVSLTGAIFVRFNSKGEIEEVRRYMDIGAMMTQLGLGPEGQA
jgi:hypothetical protein